MIKGIRQTTIVLSVLVLAAGTSCSRKSDSWTSRTYHRTVSKFNPYFNGEQAYIEGVASVETSHKDNYDEILPVYVWSKADQVSSITPQMDRAQEKGAKVIQDHSMLIKSKQKNIYVIKSYLLIAKARFYKHDFFPALETFNYVIQQFEDDPKAVDLITEARLWAGYCQLQIGNPSAALANFDELYNNKRINKKYKPQVSASMAQAHINSKDYEGAVVSLTEAIGYGPNKQTRIRWTFIRAQLHELIGNNYESSQDYKSVISMKPNDYDMLFTAQLNRAKNFDVYMENSSIVYRELERMLEDDKNEEYRDQIYYVMAQVALNEEEYDKAEEFLKRSVRTSVNNPIQKGLSYLKIADINFDFKEYITAQSYYDSTSSTLPATHKNFEFAKKRTESLTELVTNLKVIQLEDSLQTVAKLSPEKQKQLYVNYIEWLKEEEERLKREQELRELNEQRVAESQNMKGAQAVGAQGGWYFYNANTRTSGKSRFISKWGSRKLEDNWRQKNKEMVAFAEETEEVASTDSPAVEKTGGKYDVNYYLVQIPNTPEKIDTSNARIERAYVACGDIYREKLDDYDESAKSYNKLLNRYPGSTFEPRVLYSLYRLFVNQKKEPNAKPYKTQLVDKYPTSVYTQMILNPKSLSKDDEGYKKAAAFYEEMYGEFQKRKYKTVLRTLDKQKAVYESGILEPKFVLLRTMCLGKLKKDKDFMAGLNLIIDKYPGTPEALLAKNTLDLTDGGGTDPVDNSAVKGNYAYDANSPHRFIAILPNSGVDINKLRNAFADFNQKYFKLERLQIQNIFLDQNRQLIIVSGLKNSAKAKVYYKSVATNQSLMGYLPPKNTQKIIISNENYKEFYKIKDVEDYLKFLKAKYQIDETT